MKVHSPTRITYRYIVFALSVLLGLTLGEAYCTTVSGTVKVNGTPFTGRMVMQLSYPATSGSYINLPQPTGPIPISNGQFASLALDGNDILLPRGTYYAVSFYDLYGNLVTRLNYKITGTLFDLGSAIPTPILTNNVNFLDLLGIRNLSALNATFTNSIVIGSGPASYGPTGVSGAEIMNGVYFSQGYNIANPSSTTCGIVEAMTAMPSTGGTLILQPGACNVTTTIPITKPLTAIGMGKGGYSNSGLTTTIFPTTLNKTTSGPLLQVAPSASTTYSGLTLRDLNLTGAAGSGDLLQLGNASSTTAFVRNVELDGVWVNGKANGVAVVGNLDGLHITNSTLNNNTGSGLSVTAGAGYSVTNLKATMSSFSYNGADGITLSGSSVGKLDLSQTRITNNGGKGINTGAAATSSQVTVYQSTITGNASNGVLAAAGSGHVVESSTIASNGAAGVSITSAGTAGVQVLSLKDNTYSPANTTADVDNTSTAYVLEYPEVTQGLVETGTINHIAPFTNVGRTCNGNGCYIQYADGTYEMWGQTGNASSGSAATLTATFPATFAGTTNLQVVVAPNGVPTGDGNPHPMTCHITSASTTTLTTIIALPVQVGGSGYSALNSTNYCSYHAFGY